MAETLFGGEKSGTPMETRGATADFAKMFQQMMTSGAFGGGDGGRMTSEAWSNMMGFDPSGVMDEAAMASLRDPTDATRGLFASMVPFEQKQVAENVGGMRDMFGTMGGRFSRNVGEAEAGLRGEMSNQFARARQEALLTAAGQRNAALANLMQAGAAGQANQTNRLGIAAQFLQPGSPVYTEGLFPGLLGAGANLAGLYMTRGMWGNG